MNPLTNTKNQNVMNERELRLGYTGTLSSWHRQYKDSAWIFIGGLNYELTEGDVICVFSQYGEVVNINMVRDKKTGVSKGFAFLCYEDQRSTVLATDNLNGVRIAGRVIRVDHVEQYKVPKEGTVDVGGDPNKTKSSKQIDDTDLISAYVREHGCGPETVNELEQIARKQREKDKELLQLAEERARRANRYGYDDKGHRRHNDFKRRRCSLERRPADSLAASRNRSPPSPPRKRSSSPYRVKEEPPSPPRDHRSPVNRVSLSPGRSKFRRHQ